MEMLLLSSALVTLMLVLWGLFQLNERLQRLEANKHLIPKPEEAPKKTPVMRPLGDDVFHGLTGEALFQSIAGEGAPVEFTDDARKRYELITRKHILAVMDEAASGNYALSSERTIRTLRGPFVSWLPETFLTELSDLAAQLASDSENETIKGRLQGLIETLYGRLSFEPPRSFLETEEAVQHGDIASDDAASEPEPPSESKD
jgi:hypothetical protein